MIMDYKIPNDPHMLYSFVNVMLRDRFESLEEFCIVNEVDEGAIKRKLLEAGYQYNEKLNQFR